MEKVSRRLRENAVEGIKNKLKEEINKGRGKILIEKFLKQLSEERRRQIESEMLKIVLLAFMEERSLLFLQQIKKFL